MRRTFGLTLAAGLLAGLLLTSAPSPARAQFTYGYDSAVYNVPSGAMAWGAAGYSPLYTDQTTASFAGNSVAPFRPVAPYVQPPTGPFGRGRTLGGPVYLSNGTVAPSPRQPVIVVPQRRPLLRRLRGR